MTPAAALLALVVASGEVAPSDPSAPAAPADAARREEPAAPGYSFRLRAAAAAFGGLLIVDAAVAGTSLVIASAAHADDLGAGMAMAAVITGAGLWGAVYGPGMGAGFATMADGRARGVLPYVLAYACQAAALGLLVAAASESGNDHSGRSHGLLAGAAALHFVGIPLALGIGRDAPSRGAAPVASLSLAW